MNKLEYQLFELETLIQEQSMVLALLTDLCLTYCETSPEAMKLEFLITQCNQKHKLIKDKFCSQLIFDITELLSTTTRSA